MASVEKDRDQTSIKLDRRLVLNANLELSQSYQDFLDRFIE